MKADDKKTKKKGSCVLCGPNKDDSNKFSDDQLNKKMAIN